MSALLCLLVCAAEPALPPVLSPVRDAEAIDRLLPGAVILHVAARPAVYDDGHIPGARLLLLDAIVEDRDGALNEMRSVAELAEAFGAVGVDGRRPVLLCGDGHPIPAARAFVTLEYLGLRGRVAVLDGGLIGWREAGRATTVEVPAAAVVEFRPEVDDEVLVGAEQVAGAECLLDGRPTEQYRGDEPGREVRRGGHIPGAESLPLEAMLTSPELPTFRPREELAEAWREQGFTAERTVVGYCRTGMTASAIYLVGRWLGYDMRMYDGSFTEWSGDDQREVAAGGE